MVSIGIPLKLSPTLAPKPWGGRRLSLLGKQLPDGFIGESLESGSEATVAEGPYSGQTLRALVQRHPEALLGSRGVTASGELRDFPLLVKFIDAREDLSVQVHPGDGDVASGDRGKTEAWVIIAAEPGATIITGIEGDIDPMRVGEQIIRTPVAAGDVFFVRAGTIHAIGAGVLLYEVQQASDITYRVYDWGREREMHVDAAVAVTRSEQRAAPTTPLRLDASRVMLVACQHFAVERWEIIASYAVPPMPESVRVLTVLDGEITLAGIAASSGTSLVLPADIDDLSLLGSGTVLCAYIPDLEQDVVSPLRAAGHSTAAIDALGLRA
jgi:mannose-6-phosphate isomerase